MIFTLRQLCLLIVKPQVWLSVTKVRDFIGSLVYCGIVFQLEILLLAISKHTELCRKAPRCLPVVWMNLGESCLEPRIGLAHCEKCEIDADT